MNVSENVENSTTRLRLEFEIFPIYKSEANVGEGSSANPEKDICKDYINGENSIGKFRLPAIKSDEHINDDGYYQMYQLICRNKNHRTIIEEIERLFYDGKAVFLDESKEHMIYETGIIPMSPIHIEGKRTHSGYLPIDKIWKFRVSSQQECPWL